MHKVCESASFGFLMLEQITHIALPIPSQPGSTTRRITRPGDADHCFT